MKAMKIGLIVNPIAGMGGKVGLKGTDDVLRQAIARGAEPIAPERATEFLRRLKMELSEMSCAILTCPRAMGEEEARSAGFPARIIPLNTEEETDADDTKVAVKLLIAEHVDLIVFVGGDGTAKDILQAMQDGEETPVLGVPSGVKMYSGIFAVTPNEAADVVSAFVRNETELTESEIIDVDEDAIRRDTFSVKLYGLLKGPFLPAYVQGSKQVSPETVDEKDNQLAVAKFIAEGMYSEGTYILGPGTTVKSLAEVLGVEKTVLGVDIYRSGKMVLDVNEKRILEQVKDWENAWIVLSPIGRQGILIGRGNQQISPEIIKRVGKERLIIAATKSKMRGFEGGILRVDTDDSEVNQMLKGYVRVVTDYREWRLVEVQ